MAIRRFCRPAIVQLLINCPDSNTTQHNTGVPHKGERGLEKGKWRKVNGELIIKGFESLLGQEGTRGEKLLKKNDQKEMLKPHEKGFRFACEHNISTPFLILRGQKKYLLFIDWKYCLSIWSLPFIFSRVVVVFLEVYRFYILWAH